MHNPIQTLRRYSSYVTFDLALTLTQTAPRSPSPDISWFLNRYPAALDDFRLGLETRLNPSVLLAVKTFDRSTSESTLSQITRRQTPQRSESTLECHVGEGLVIDMLLLTLAAGLDLGSTR